MYKDRAQRSRTNKDWEVKRAVFLKKKSCEWCHSASNLVVAPKNPLPSYAFQLKAATALLLQQKMDEGEFYSEKREVEACPGCGSTSISSRKLKKPSYRCLSCRFEFDTPLNIIVSSGRLSKENWGRFWSKYGPGIKRKIAEERGAAERAYFELVDCMVLCRRCHFARLKGLELCPKCRMNYRRRGKEMCWQCFIKTDEGREVAKRYEELIYKHPWCGRDFNVERQFWDIAANPEVCCIELCEVTPERCETAKEKWDIASSRNPP